MVAMNKTPINKIIIINAMGRITNQTITNIVITIAI